jgi:hypothetical protein
MRRIVVATSVAILLLALAASTMIASAASLDPGRPGADVSAPATAQSDSLTSSDADTTGPGPAGTSSTDQDYDVDCSAPKVVASTTGGAGRRTPLSIPSAAGQGSTSRVACGGGAS